MFIENDTRFGWEGMKKKETLQTSKADVYLASEGRRRNCISSQRDSGFSRRRPFVVHIVQDFEIVDRRRVRRFRKRRYVVQMRSRQRVVIPPGQNWEFPVGCHQFSDLGRDLVIRARRVQWQQPDHRPAEFFELHDKWKWNHKKKKKHKIRIIKIICFCYRGHDTICNSIGKTVFLRPKTI